MTHLLYPLILGTMVVGGEALNHVRMDMPGAVLRGGTATLRCHFDLEEDALYSVKWYKGGSEFYRFTPRETPPSKAFPIPRLPQLQVELALSNASQVSLKSVTPALSGKYSCEVSADFPSFHTILKTGHLDVVTAPRQRPSLQGLRARYRTGDTLRANCTSADSQPAANLSWLLNQHQVDKRYVKIYHVVRENGDDLETSTSILEKTLTPHDFNSNSRLKIRCTASILSVYWQTTEKSAEWEQRKNHVTDSHFKSNSPLLNLNADSGSSPIGKDDSPTRVSQPMFSCSTRSIVIPTLLIWRIFMFQYNLVLT